MTKNYSKLIFLILIVLFLEAIPVSARKMTVDELGKELDQLKYEVDSYYIIGEYVFTNNYEINTRDIMYASRSIHLNTEEITKETKDEILKNMTIYKVQRHYNESLEKEGWDILSNYVGKTELKKDTVLDIKYIDYEYYAEISKAEIKFEKEIFNQEEYQNALKNTFGFTQDTKLYVNLTNNNGQLTGLMLKHEINEKPGFTEKDQTGYYLPFVIEVPGLTQDTIVSIKEDHETIATYNHFDKKDNADGKNPGMVVLWSIPGEKEKKEITITVDLDGESKKEYGPTTYIIDYSGLTYQTSSKVSAQLNQATEVDQQIMANWGYNSSLNVGEDKMPLALSETEENGKKVAKLKGTLVEQELTSKEAFGEANKTGFYFDFTFVLPEGLTKENTTKARILQLKSDQMEENENIKKEFKKEEFDSNGNLTILFRIKPDTKCESNNCKIYFKVDWDGDDDNYLPTIYTIDYSEVTLEKSSKFTVEAISEDDKTKIPTDDSGAWYDKENGYSVTITPDATDSKKYKVTGVLPIFDDSGEAYKNNFDTQNKTLYYLGLLLKTVHSGQKENISINFYQKNVKDTQFLKGTNDGETNDLYVLKALCENSTDGGIIPAEEKIFTITVDLDDAGKEYAPYTVTVDWSGLRLQSVSNSNPSNYEVMHEKEILEDSEERKELTKYHYNYEAAQEVQLDTVKNEEDQTLTKKGIKGKIKEQTLDSSAGFKENKGYFVPIKVEFPGKNDPDLQAYQNTWTLILNTEDHQTKEYVPTAKEYDQGWVMVLFKIEKDVMEGTKKSIKYQVDFDGTPNQGNNLNKNTGYEFVPGDYAIDYDQLEFVESRNVTFQGTNVTKESWEGDKISLNDLPTPTLEDDYHQFAYWNKTDGTKIDEITVGEEDIELVPHWNIAVDKFIEDVIKDGETKDYAQKLIFSQDEAKNNIKVKIIDPQATLNVMNTTSIPGVIAYALVKDEIKEITFEVNEENQKTFTKNGVKTINTEPEINDLKSKVEVGIKELYQTVLKDTSDTTTTLSAMANGSYASFKIKIAEVDPTVTLLSEDAPAPTEYTFTFETTVSVVNNERELKEAIQKEKITDILINQGFELDEINSDVKKSHTLVIDIPNRTLRIASLDKNNIQIISDKEPTEEGENDKTPVIEVKNGMITFENLKIEGATRAISVLSGATVIAHNITAINSQDTAFDIAAGATFEGSELKYQTEDGTNKESYHYPTICGKGNITISDVPNYKKIENYQRINHLTNEKYTEDDLKDPETKQYYPEFRDPNGGLNEAGQKLLNSGNTKYWDELKNTGHTHYYLDPENAEYYMVHLRDGAITRRYFVKDETISLNPINYKSTGFFKNVLIINNLSYVQDGWSKESYYSLTSNGREYHWSTPQVTNPKEVANLTLEPRYVPGYSVTIKDGETTYRFGVKKEDSKSLNELMTLIPEFKTLYDKLSSEAESSSKQVVDQKNQSVKLNLDEKISKDMELIVGDILKNSLTSFEGPKLEELASSGENYILKTPKEEDHKYYMSVTLTSENFKDNVSEIKVMNPNGKETTYKYNQNEANNITLELEALKTSQIQNGSKIYTIEVDVDGKENQYAVDYYTLDYSNIKTIVEEINDAAKKTQAANSLTVERQNKIKDVSENSEEAYNKISGRRLIKNKTNHGESYTFNKNEVDSSALSETKVNVEKGFPTSDQYPIVLNEWHYNNTYTKIGYGVYELELLKDVIQVGNVIEAIKEVEEQGGSYTVTIYKDKLENWLNSSYIDSLNETRPSEKYTSDNETLKIKITLNNGYISHLETLESFSIKSSSSLSPDNTINLNISNVDNTQVDSPTKIILGAETETEETKAKLTKFLEDGLNWWHSHSGSSQG